MGTTTYTNPLNGEPEENTGYDDGSGEEIGSGPSPAPIGDSNISSHAQEVADTTINKYNATAMGVGSKQDGVGAVSFEKDRYAPDIVGKAIDDNMNIKKGSTYVTAATDTVAGQISTLLQDDNPYIQLAEQSGREGAASRGLLNTTLAEGAARRSAIEAALPIARQDAQMYSEKATAQQDAEYYIDKAEGEAIIASGLNLEIAAIQRRQTDANNAFEMMLSGLDKQAAVFFQDMNNKFQQNLQETITESQERMKNLDLTEKQRSELQSSIDRSTDNMHYFLEQIYQNPEFLEMEPEDQQNVITSLANNTANSIDLKLTGYDPSVAGPISDAADLWLESFFSESEESEDPDDPDDPDDPTGWADLTDEEISNVASEWNTLGQDKWLELKVTLGLSDGRWSEMEEDDKEKVYDYLQTLED